MSGPPSSPRGWLCRASYILAAQARPRSPSYEYTGRSDPRTRCSREEALSIKILLEKASAKCTRNGVGLELMMRMYVLEAPWTSFSDRERRAIKKTARAFAEALRAEGFLPGEG